MAAALIAMLLAAPVSRALPASRPVLVLLVRQETREPFDRAALHDIDRQVARLWQRYADVSVHDDTDAVVPAADDVLTLVITDALSRSGDGLGWIEFTDGQPSHTIYVSRGEAVRLASGGRWSGRQVADWPPKLRDIFLRRALATAAAHEVGHYLLRSREHATSGLMRPQFTFNDLMNAPHGAYRLDPSEEPALRQRMRVYLMARNNDDGV